MGRRVVYFSDLTNKVLADDRGLERIVVVRHPALRDGPVELEASEDEIESIRSRALRLVSLVLTQDNGSPLETVTIDIDAFNNLAGDRDMAEVLRQAGSASQSHETKAVSTSTNDGLTMPVVASAEKTLTMPVVASAEETLTMPADASTKEGYGIWPWLAGLGLALVVLGVLAWTGLLSSVGAP